MDVSDGLGGETGVVGGRVPPHVETQSTRGSDTLWAMPQRLAGGAAIDGRLRAKLLGQAPTPGWRGGAAQRPVRWGDGDWDGDGVSRGAGGVRAGREGREAGRQLRLGGGSGGHVSMGRGSGEEA